MRAPRRGALNHGWKHATDGPDPVTGGLTDPTTTKGDLIARATAALARLAVGAAGTVLTPDSSTATGLAWATPKVDIGCDDIPTILATSASTHYERHPSRPSVIRLRSPNNFPTAQTIAAASPEFGWTWLNRTLLTTANENTTTANAVYGDHDATNTDWNAAAPTCPARLQTIDYTGQPLEIVALCYSNGDAAWENVGIVFAINGTKSTFVKMFVGYNGNVSGLRVSSNQNVGGGVTASSTTPTSGERDAGVWLRMVAVGGVVQCWYNLTASAEPPTTWTYLQTYTSSTAVYGVACIGMVWITVNTSNTLTGGFKWFGWRTDVHAAGWPGTMPAFQGTRRATAGETIKLIASADFGLAVLPSQAKMRLLLADAINRVDGGAGTWTFGITSSASASPAAPTTLQAAASVELKLAGTDTVTTTAARYWAVHASCASTNGEQEGNIDTALVRIVT